MINVIIDELTNCLEVRQTGEIVDTYYKERKKKFTDKEIAKMHAEGWSLNFNWKSVQDEGYQIFELRTEKDHGNEGYVVFESKTDLVRHYIKTLSATIMKARIPVELLLDTKAAANLIQKYFFAKEDSDERE